MDVKIEDTHCLYCKNIITTLLLVMEEKNNPPQCFCSQLCLKDYVREMTYEIIKSSALNWLKENPLNLKL